MKVILLIACVFMCSVCFAQGDPGGNPDSENMPLDGGVVMMLVTAAGYGAAKIKQARARKEE